MKEPVAAWIWGGASRVNAQKFLKHFIKYNIRKTVQKNNRSYKMQAESSMQVFALLNIFCGEVKNSGFDHNRFVN